MKNENAVNGQVKGLQNITRLGVILMMVSFAATSAHAASASKSVSVGNSKFGAAATMSFNDYVSGDKYRATLAARADGKVLTKSLSLASGTSSLEIQRWTNCHAYGNLKLAGITVASWNKSASGSVSFTTAPFVKTLVGGKTTIMIGPVPVTFKGSAKVRLSAKGKVNVSLSTTTGLPVVQGSIGPAMDITATASAGVDLRWAGVDLRSSLTLVGVGLTGDITYTPQITSNPAVVYSVTVDIRSTDGVIKACAWVDPPWPLPGGEWCKTIFEYHGGRKSYVIASGSLPQQLETL